MGWEPVVCFIAALIFIYKVIKLDHPSPPEKPDHFYAPPGRYIIVPPPPPPPTLAPVINFEDFPPLVHPYGTTPQGLAIEVRVEMEHCLEHEAMPSAAERERVAMRVARIRWPEFFESPFDFFWR